MQNQKHMGNSALMHAIRKQSRFVVALAFVLSFGLVGTAAATQTLTSPHYSVTETQIGPGSSLQQCSGSGTYCAKASLGDTAVGRASSTSYAAQIGSDTTDEPFLAVIVTGGTQDMGVLDDTHTGTAVSTIDVRTYLSSGYVMQIAGAAPSQGTHNLNVPLGEPGDLPFTSSQGTEQFGINLADNTAPNIGASAVNEPDGSANSTVTSNYNQPDLFAYKDGDIVAHSTTGNGEVLYTMSMIINVSNVTPGGRYSGVYSTIVTSTF